MTRKSIYQMILAVCFLTLGGVILSSVQSWMNVRKAFMQLNDAYIPVLSHVSEVSLDISVARTELFRFFNGYEPSSYRVIRHLDQAYSNLQWVRRRELNIEIEDVILTLLAEINEFKALLDRLEASMKADDDVKTALAMNALTGSSTALLSVADNLKFLLQDHILHSNKALQKRLLYINALLAGLAIIVLVLLITSVIFQNRFLNKEVEEKTKELRNRLKELFQSEKALQESEERLRRVVENMPVMMDALDNPYNFIVWNRECERVTGYSHSEIVGNPKALELLYPDTEYRRRMIDELTETGFDFRDQEYDITCKNGMIRTISWSNISSRFPIPGWFTWAVGVDVTERKKAESALSQSEEKFRTLVEESPLGISLIDKNGYYKYINPEFIRIFGYTLEDLPTGSEWFKKAYPDTEYRSAVITAWLEDQNRVPIGISRPRTYTVVCKNGSKKEIHFRPVTMENLDQFVIYEDITEKSKLEKQLQQAQKFEAIGTLAGGIAHDFNNLLMGIQGRASLMLIDLEPSHPHTEHLGAIEEYIRSAVDLTKQLLGFARGGKYEVRPIDINELMVNSSRMFARTKKEIRLHTKLWQPPPVVEADRSQLEQVFLNLFVNAWQAMPKGGDIYLETQVVNLDDAYCHPYDIEPGIYAKISVTDTGIGMDEAVRIRIFDPFFTTKEKSRGTGMGLASAYGIIKNHGGIITIYSEIGQGATFNIFLPVSDKQSYPEVSTEPRIDHGSGMILLVDDEEMIIDVGKAMLEKLGFQVMIAENGPRAIDIVKKNPRGIDLVILDMIMPGMDGGQVFEKIRKIRPDIPVLLSSGYSINGKPDDILKQGCNGFIQKPFNLSELSQKIQSILKSLHPPDVSERPPD